MPKVALLQMLVKPGEPDANLQRAEELINEALAKDSRILVLPEAMDFGWTHPSARDGAESIPNGRICQRLIELARHNEVFICSGLIERAGNQLFNSALLIDSKGQILLHHRKINELDIAFDLYSRGDRLSVCDTEHGRIGIMICADAFVEGQTISRALGEMGAQFILSPCAWAVPADHDNIKDPYGKLWIDNYGPVAEKFGIAIAGVSNVGPIIAGPWKGRQCIGSSLVVGPDGKKILQGTYGVNAEEILFCSMGTESI
jgi:predicted amidohydrolase